MANEKDYLEEIQAARERRTVEKEIEQIAKEIKKHKDGTAKMSNAELVQTQLLLKARKDELKLLDKIKDIHDDNLSIQDKEAALSYDIAGADKKLLQLD